MGRGLAWLVSAALAVGMATPDVAVADAFDDCRMPGAAARRMAACSAVIAGSAFSPQQKAFAYRLRGSARLDAGALDQALTDLDAAIGLDATDATSRLLRGQARVGRKNLDGAIADFSVAISLNPRAGGAYAGRGHAHLVKGDAAKALDDFTQAIALAPELASNWNNRGLAHRRAGNIERAIADYTAAITRNPIYALAYNNRGYAYEARGERAQAVLDYRQALLIDPSLSGARQALERLKAVGPLAAESSRLIAEGKALVEKHCSRCHATGAAGESPNAKATPFRALHTRHPVLALREPLTRGIAAPHDEMPRFALADPEIDKIVAYVNSLSPAR
jgi:tetratricopeptide (TPR) repeat protein